MIKEPSTHIALDSNKYRCAQCNGVFEKGWSDDDALAEAVDQFFPEELEDTVVVCDDCYRSIMGSAPTV